MLAVFEAKHIDVIDADRAAGWRDVARRTMQNAVVVPVNVPSSTATSPEK
jgi:hypothetical protein